MWRGRQRAVREAGRRQAASKTTYDHPAILYRADRALPSISPSPPSVRAERELTEIQHANDFIQLIRPSSFHTFAKPSHL